MIRVRVAVVLAGLALFGAEAGWAESPEEMFLRAGRAYDAGRYDEAVETYESLVGRGVADPRVEFNLGNAEFRRGRIGRAILHFERARRLDPTDPEILGNLAFARAHAGDGSSTAEADSPPALVWAQGRLDRLGPTRLAWTSLTLAWLVALVLAWGLAEPGRFRAVHGWLVALLLAALASTILTWYVIHQRLVAHQVAVVLAPQAVVLAGPDDNNAQLATVPEGLSLEVWGERPDWVHVRLPNGVSGWVDRTAVGLVP